MKKQFLFLLFTLLLCGGMFPMASQAADSGITDFYDAYVYAPSGLSLRAEPSLSAKRLATVPFKEGVNVLSFPEMGDIEGEEEAEVIPETFPFREATLGEPFYVDGFLGGWIKVSWGEFTGYMFSGYLCRFVPPQGEYVDIGAFMKAHFATEESGVRESGKPGYESYQKTTYYELGAGVELSQLEHYESSSQTVTMPSISVQEAFLFIRAGFHPEWTRLPNNFPTKAMESSKPLPGYSPKDWKMLPASEGIPDFYFTATVHFGNIISALSFSCIDGTEYGFSITQDEAGNVVVSQSSSL